MKLLKQNYHGLPGIGISGKIGQTGENGKSIYFGFINDFFDGDRLDVATCIYVAKRALNQIDYEGVIDTSIAQQIAEAEIQSVFGSQNSAFLEYFRRVNNAEIDKMPYMDYRVFYYTGNRMSKNVAENTIDRSVIDNGEGIKLDINGDFISMSFMVYGAIQNSISSRIELNKFKQYKFENDDTTQKDLANQLNINKNTIYQNITNEITHYAFNNSAAVKMDIKKPDYGYNNNSAITYDTIDAIYNNDEEAAEEYAKGNILNDSDYSDYYTNTNPVYITEDIEFNNNILYALDSNSYFAEFKLTSDTYKSGLYTNEEINGRRYFSDTEDIKFWNEIYKTSAIVNKNDVNYQIVHMDGDIQDAADNSFYGVPPRALFTVDDDNIIINRTGDASSFLEKFPNYYNKDVDSYKNQVEALVRLSIDNNNTNVYYSLSSNDTTLFIPMSLRSDIKPGDVIYFYTNTDEFSETYNVNYMVAVTEDLLNCTPRDLINSATLIDPLNVKFFNSISKNRLCNFHDVAVLKNNYGNYGNASLNLLANKSYISIVDEYTTAPVLLASKRDFLMTTAHHNINGYADNHVLLFDINNNQFVTNTQLNAIKINHLGVNESNLTEMTNIELSKFVYNSNIILYDNYFIKPLTDLDLYHDNSNDYASAFVQIVNGNEYFRNIENLDDYFYGCDIYNQDMEKINTITSNTETLNIEIIPTINNTVYYMQMFASCGTSLKYYSKITKLTLVYEQFKFINDIKNMQIISSKTDIIGKNPRKKKIVYNSPIDKYSKNITTPEIRQQLKTFKLEILGDEQNIIKQKYNGNIIFDISDITAEKNDGISLNIYSYDDNIQILDVMFNNKTYTSQINVNDWSYIQEVENSSWFEYTIDMSTNLPIFDPTTQTQPIDTLNEYVQCGHSVGQDEASLFTRLTNNITVEPSKPRSILVTAKYKFRDSNEIYYENFNLTQPGFNDTRNVPVVDLDIHSNIIDLESFNKIENGVLANQFITYLDVDITKFKEYWGKFANASTDIKMDIELRNLQYDFDWQNKYVVKDLYARKTFRAIYEQDNASILNNYVKTKIDIDESTLNKDQISVLLNSEIQTYNTSFMPTFINDNNVQNDNGKYILFDSSSKINDVISKSNIIYNGLQNNIIINLSSIDINHDYDKIRLKLLSEIGNPILSNIYYRFYVKNISIGVTINDGQNTSCNFYTYVPETIDENAGQTYLCQTGLEHSTNVINVNYKYTSEPLDVTFNPLSYTICPNDIENTYTNIYGDNTYKYGVKEQIIKELKFFNDNAYTSNNYNVKDKKTIRNGILYDYANLNIKKSYIQDNIKNIIVKPISLYDVIQNVSTDEYKSLKFDESLKTHYVLDFIEGNKYLSIAYHSVLMQPKIRNNQYTFFYNDKEYVRTKYDQKLNNLPIFAYDEQSINLRDDKLINSMDKWNDWYADNKQDQNTNTYTGILSLYGNGYTQIANSSVQFKDYYSLDEVNEMNNDIITTYAQSNEINIEPMKQNQPNKGEYFRGFVYDINWEFPYYNNNNIIPYRIVSPFDNLLRNTASSNGTLPENCNMYQNYYNALIEKHKPIRERLYSDHMIPYTLLYDIQPRVAYNYENNKINVFMLRRPSIGVDTDIIDSSIDFAKKYEFNRRLFNLNDFKKLTTPYNI